MNKTIIILFAIATLIACKKEKAASTEISGNAETVQENKETNDWTVLFDGSSYDHWRGYLIDSMHTGWTIEDGAMAFTPGEKGGKNIITKEKYTNFILSLEWKISAGGNSGIFWSVFENEKFPEAYQTGPEIQVLDNALHADAKVANGTHKAGSLYDMIACPDEAVKPAVSGIYAF